MFNLFDLLKEELWPLMCTEIASGIAEEFNKKNPDKPPIKYAEAFRLQYLGTVDKIKETLPASDTVFT